MKKIYACFFLLTFATGIKSQTSLGLSWLGGMGAENNDELGAMAVDFVTNDIILGGKTSSTVDFNMGAGSYTLASSTEHAFFAKYTQSGSFVWARQLLGQTASSSLFGITTDASSNIYITGTFNGGVIDVDPANPGTNTIAPISISDMFVVKYDANGSYQWHLHITGPGANVIPASIVTDTQGNVIVAGTMDATGLPIEMNPAGPSWTIDPSPNSKQVFVAKYNSNGVLSWALDFGGTQNDYVYEVLSDASDNIYVCGDFRGSADFNPISSPATVSTSIGSADMFIAKYASNGSLSWVNTMGGGAADEGIYRMALDNNSDLYVSGYMSSPTMDADPGAGVQTLSKIGSTTFDVFLGKYNGTTGAYVWAKNTGGPGLGICHDIALDVQNNIYLTGPFVTGYDFDFSPTLTHSLTTLTSGGFPDIYISKYDPSGQHLLTKNFGGANNNGNEGDYIYVNPSNEIILAGLYGNTINFDPVGSNTLQTYGLKDMFLNKYFQCIPAETPTLSGTSYSVCSNGVATVSVVNGNLNSNTTWVWSALSCGSFSSGTGTSFTVSPILPTTYFVRGEGGCAAAGNCASVTIVPLSSKDITGMVTENSNPVPGKVVLFKYEGPLTKWDSITYQNINALGEYTMNAVNEGTYIIQAIPNNPTLQISYAPNKLTWKEALVFNHGCLNITTQNIAVAPLVNPGMGPGVISGKVTEGIGFGQRGETAVPGNPIGGLNIKVGKNPGGAYNAQGRTNAAGEYTLSGLDTCQAGETYFVFVDIPGLDTNGTYHLAINTGSLTHSNIDFIADSDYVRPASGVGFLEWNKEQKGIWFYPNPASSKIYISAKGIKDEFELSIYDLNGRHLMKKEVQANHILNDYQLDVSEFNPGIYFIRIISEEYIKSEKIIIVKQ